MDENLFPHTQSYLSVLAQEYPQTSMSTKVGRDVVMKVVELLEDEDEDGLKQYLQDSFSLGDIGLIMVEQFVLDLMHKVKDDRHGVPFTFHTPTKRPISRPSSRASSHSFRFVSRPASPLMSSTRRPHTPVSSSLSSPIVLHPPSSTANMMHMFSSRPSSPATSPSLLNAKALEFRPGAKPLVTPSLPTGRNNVKSELSLQKSDDNFVSLRSSNTRDPRPDLYDVPSNVRGSTRVQHNPYDDVNHDVIDMTPLREMASFSFFGEGAWDTNPNSIEGQNSAVLHPNSGSPIDGSRDIGQVYQEDQAIYHGFSAATVGAFHNDMTPFEILASVFGAAIEPSSLEEALEKNAYDFDSAMAWLIDQDLGSNSTKLGETDKKIDKNDLKGTTVGRQAYSGSYSAQHSGKQSEGRICRYFLAGDCRRADCRFSHTIDRALCRFWLRDQCAKGDQCEFLHSLPPQASAISPGTTFARNLHDPQNTGSQRDEFPSLSTSVSDVLSLSISKTSDPGRTRFATAVKKAQVSSEHPSRSLTSGFKRPNALGNYRPANVSPRPSPRIKLRPPSLMPTLPTGDVVNRLYLEYRSGALRLGASRNALLTKAAEAWKRGDGATAKKCSKEAQIFNNEMITEAARAAQNLIRERTKTATEAVRSRDASWSDDPLDRNTRGRLVGGGLGVIMGVASEGIAGLTGSGKMLAAEERTECLLDLHGLHASEAVDVLEEFLMTLEREHYLGLVYLVVGEEKHTGTQNIARGASRARLSSGVKNWLHNWQYPWNERDGIICLDPITHL